MSDPKQWTTLVALETALSGIATFNTVTIGLLEDMFHKTKFRGKLPAAIIEWRGDEEEGSDDSEESRVVPFVATVTVFQEAGSVKLNRREKLKIAMQYARLVKDKYEEDTTLGGLAEYLHSKVMPSRMSERLPPPFWGMEVDLRIQVREPMGAR